jgi:hypothetical protein
LLLTKKLKKYYMTVIIVCKMIFEKEGLENNIYRLFSFWRNSLSKLKSKSKLKIIPPIILLMIMLILNSYFMLLSLGLI